MRNSNYVPDVISFNTMIDGSLKAGNVQYAKELITDTILMCLCESLADYNITVILY
ncbi:hypothetical protein LINPERPRIM_LOCUS22706 [Linum perenne]